ncbi:MAG TPA: agmatine deiminase [Steroidobacteraceae bacterium]|nr:agmatine deiminase [Steroidobacteraceae bacterium]
MTATLRGTPARHGFRMPAESEPHAGCWMLWPERPDNWRRRAQPAQAAFTAVAAAIADFEPVTMGVTAAQFDVARAQLPARIRLVEVSHDDAWMRDVGPTGVVNAAGELRGIDWPFNAWGGHKGGLYASWELDDHVARKVLEIEGAARYRAPLINEGGAIHVDGEGTALVTEQCLLNRNRNPGRTRLQIEGHLKQYLGVSRVIWLGRGVFNDETDGHIDNLACFVRPGEVCLTWCEDPKDPQHAISKDALERLLAARDARDRRLQVHRVPAPGPLYMTAREASGVERKRGSHARLAGWRLAGSYVNFYLANGGLVMPLLDSRTDRSAARVLRRLFPDRKVVGVPAREILLGGGNIHCITQQLPAHSA